MTYGRSADNLTDLNNIPKHCPYLLIYHSYILYLWGSGTLGKPIFFFFKRLKLEDNRLPYGNPSDNADMSNDKGILYKSLYV